MKKAKLNKLKMKKEVSMKKQKKQKKLSFKSVVKTGVAKVKAITLRDVTNFIRVQIAIKIVYYAMIYAVGFVGNIPLLITLCAVIYGIAKVYSIVRALKKVFHIKKLTLISVIIFIAIFSYTFTVSLHVGHNLFEMIGLATIYLITYIFYKKQK